MRVVLFFMKSVSVFSLITSVSFSGGPDEEQQEWGIVQATSDLYENKENTLGSPEPLKQKVEDSSLQPQKTGKEKRKAELGSEVKEQGDYVGKRSKIGGAEKKEDNGKIFFNRWRRRLTRHQPQGGLESTFFTLHDDAFVGTKESIQMACGKVASNWFPKKVRIQKLAGGNNRDLRGLFSVKVLEGGGRIKTIKGCEENVSLEGKGVCLIKAYSKKSEFENLKKLQQDPRLRHVPMSSDFPKIAWLEKGVLVKNSKGEEGYVSFLHLAKGKSLSEFVYSLNSEDTKLDLAHRKKILLTAGFELGKAMANFNLHCAGLGSDADWDLLNEKLTLFHQDLHLSNIFIAPALDKKNTYQFYLIDMESMGEGIESSLHVVDGKFMPLYGQLLFLLYIPLINSYLLSPEDFLVFYQNGFIKGYSSCFQDPQDFEDKYNEILNSMVSLFIETSNRSAKASTGKNWLDKFQVLQGVSKGMNAMLWSIWQHSAEGGFNNMLKGIGKLLGQPADSDLDSSEATISEPLGLEEREGVSPFNTP